MENKNTYTTTIVLKSEFHSLYRLLEISKIEVKNNLEKGIPIKLDFRDGVLRLEIGETE